MECLRVMANQGQGVLRCGQPGEPVSVPGAYEVLCPEHRLELDAWLAKMASVINPYHRKKRTHAAKDGALVWLDLHGMQAQKKLRDG